MIEFLRIPRIPIDARQKRHIMRFFYDFWADYHNVVGFVAYGMVGLIVSAELWVLFGAYVFAKCAGLGSLLVVTAREGWRYFR